MRSHLLITVEHLPTINEEGPCNDVHLSNGLEEYAKSILTLAQPSSLTEDLMKQGQARSKSKNWHKPRSLFMGCKGRVLNPQQDNVTSPNNLNAAEAIADPLAWLYRASGKENQDSQEKHASIHLTLQQNQQSNTLHILGTCQHHISKYQCSEKQIQQRRKSRSQRLQKKCRFTGYTCRGALNILQKPQLPIIYEF
ncbi:hypothetical protein XELAEV_18035165mg [Xenopus laevis]|uniref:Uncharacterized protein n=1 Tax=Xenopus laevis TaxID=8355 RepID=A0A974CF51_XENLA|nr:hypothetical protein XELAEV_18035165mg [Xenopus laevis]